MKTMRLNCAAAIALGVLFVLGISGCGGGGSGGSESAPQAAGRVAVLLTDGPAEDFAHVWITLESIELISEGGHVFLPVDDTPFDLLDLQGDATLFAVGEDVPAGTYSKIRLGVSDLKLERNDGPTVVPKLPGNGKIDLNPRGSFEVRPGELLVLELDLDAEKSIHTVHAGNGDKVLFRPVVFVKARGVRAEGKPVRLRGTVEEVGEHSFVLCPLSAFRPEGGGVSGWLTGRCFEVFMGPGASLFDEEGNPAELGALEPGDEVTVVGRLEMAEQARAAETEGVRIQALTVEIGNYLRLRGTVASDVQMGKGEYTFAFALVPGQGISGALEIEVRGVPETKILSVGGRELGVEALGVGRRTLVDGVLFRADETADVVKAALILVDDREAGLEVSGTVTAVEDAGGLRRLAVATAGGGTVCGALSASTTAWRLEQGATEVVVEPIGIDAIGAGDAVRLFGGENADDCLAVETAFQLVGFGE